MQQLTKSYQLELLNTFLSSDILSFNFITSDNSFFMEKFVYALNIFVRDPFIYNFKSRAKYGYEFFSKEVWK